MENKTTDKKTNKKLTSTYNKVEVFFMLNYLYEMPEDVKSELGKNFCAMKYIHSLPEKKRKKVIQKASKMSPNELKNYVSYLGRFI